MIRTQDLSPADSIAAVRGCFDDLAPAVDRVIIPPSADAEGWLSEQDAFAEEEISSLRRQIEARKVEPHIALLTERLLSGRGLSMADASETEKAFFEVGVARALVEQQRLFQHRLREPLLPYSRVDPLFAAGSFASNWGPASDEPPPSKSEGSVGPHVTQVVERYLVAKQGSWVPKTRRTNEAKLKLFIDHVGSIRRIETITPADVRTFRDGTLRLRRNNHVGAGKTFSERQTGAESHRVGPATALLILESIKAFFRWAAAEGYISSNPAQTITVEVPKSAKGKKARRPFFHPDLICLFSSPPFSGCLSVHRRFEVGQFQPNDAWFWIPILAYYTGMRLGEIVQLHIEDVHIDGSIPYISITEDNTGEVGSGFEKHVKSDAGVRVVPLHPDVMALGFATFRKQRAKSHKAKKRLFWEIGYGKDGQPSTLFSKWFARLLDKIGLTDPALVFHSFRHGVEDAFRNALTPEYVIDQIVGHADGKVSSQYGQGVSLQVKYDAIKGLKLPVSLPMIIGK